MYINTDRELKTIFIYFLLCYIMIQIHCTRKRPTSDGAERRPVAGRLGPEISTHDNPADMMTKPVPIAKFEFCSSLVGLTA